MPNIPAKHTSAHKALEAAIEEATKEGIVLALEDAYWWLRNEAHGAAAMEFWAHYFTGPEPADRPTEDPPHDSQ